MGACIPWEWKYGKGQKGASGRTNDFLKVRGRAPMEKLMTVWEDRLALRRTDGR